MSLYDVTVTFRVCRECGAEAPVAVPEAEHPHFRGCTTGQMSDYTNEALKKAVERSKAPPTEGIFR